MKKRPVYVVIKVGMALRDGDVIVTEVDVHYARVWTVTHVTVPCCNVFRFRDGAVAEYRTYIDATPVYA